VITERMDLLGWLRKQLAEADTDLLREMVRSFAEALMGAEADSEDAQDGDSRGPLDCVRTVGTAKTLSRELTYPLLWFQQKRRAIGRPGRPSRTLVTMRATTRGASWSS